MNIKVTLFPVYRKLTNSIRIYKIDDERNFKEKQHLGSKVLEYSIIAHQYPEILRIKDMISCNGFEIADENEWVNF
jgi:hypothetical protein